MTTRSWLIFAGMIGVLFAMIAIYGIKYDPRSVSQTIDEANVALGDTLRVSAKALAGAYAKDEGRADRVFKNHLCEVTGQIVGIDVNWLGEPVVQLDGDRVKRVAVSLVFQKSEQQRVNTLELGETISVLGICVGKEPRYGVRFKQCMFVTRAEAKGRWDMKEQ